MEQDTRLAIDRVNWCLAAMGLPAAEDLAVPDRRIGLRTAVAFGLFELEHRLGLGRARGPTGNRLLVGERLALVESVLFDKALTLSRA